MTTLTKLPMLEPHKSQLEKCVYCPKLCRASCPVSNAHPSETLIPWGKMSAAYFMGRGDVPIDAENAATMWACSGCLGCRERCDHKNDVASVLYEARAEAFVKGVAPEAATRAARDFSADREATGARARTIAKALDVEDARGSLLVGCGYHALALKGEATPTDALAVKVAGALAGEKLRPVEACCGLPLLQAGDLEGFRCAATEFARELAGRAPFVAVDPGCARTILKEYPRFGVKVEAPTLLVDLAASKLDAFSTIGGPAPRYHDPCQLGRGLGKFEEPRRVLAKIAGAPPREFQRSGLHADCSGGGGMLPAAMPIESAAIADARIAEHRANEGGPLVSACASSIRRFRASGEAAEDLVTWMARGLGIEPHDAGDGD